MSRAGTFFTLDIYEAAVVAQALRGRIELLRKEAENPRNTEIVALQITNDLASCEAVSQRLRLRFRRVSRALQALREKPHAG